MDLIYVHCFSKPEYGKEASHGYEHFFFHLQFESAIRIYIL
jgi:hypothetical protein